MIVNSPPVWYMVFWSTLFVLYCLFWIWRWR